MSNIMAVLLNNIAQLEYNRDIPLPAHQAAYLDKMDEKMAKGIIVADKTVKNPELNQRAQFVSANLVHALKNDNEELAVSMCTWLADRMPELKQVKIEENNGEVSIDLVFDEDYKKQVEVKFTH